MERRALVLVAVLIMLVAAMGYFGHGAERSGGELSAPPVGAVPSPSSAAAGEGAQTGRPAGVRKPRLPPPATALPSALLRSVVCMPDAFFGRTSNRFIEVSSAIRYARSLGNASFHPRVYFPRGRWSDWASDWFDLPHPHLLVDHAEDPVGSSLEPACLPLHFSKRGRGKQHAYHEIKALFYYDNYDPDMQVPTVLHALRPKLEHWDRARSIADDYGPFISVHRRNLEHSCGERARNSEVWCPDASYRKANFFEDCQWTEPQIRSYIQRLDPSMATLPVVLFSDGENPARDATFAVRDDADFKTQMVLMTMSELHFASPMSSVDFMVWNWRGGDGRMRPRACWGEAPGNRTTERLGALTQGTITFSYGYYTTEGRARALADARAAGWSPR